MHICFKTKCILVMLFHATYHYLFEMHFKDYQATHLHLMINVFQGICVDLKCVKGKYILFYRVIYLAMINCLREMHFKPYNELEGL